MDSFGDMEDDEGFHSDDQFTAADEYGHDYGAPGADPFPAADEYAAGSAPFSFNGEVQPSPVPDRVEDSLRQHKEDFGLTGGGYRSNYSVPASSQ
jgi:hypothetical protein